MLKNWEFSKKRLPYIYAAFWIIGFAFIALYIYSGKIFEPINGKINIIAIGIAWIWEYLGQIGTSMLFFLYGVYRALKNVLVRKPKPE